MPSTDRRTDGRTRWIHYTPPPPPPPPLPSNFVGWGHKYTTNGSSVYLDCFISLPVSRSTSSAHAYMPRLLHSSYCSTVPTFCTDNDLGSRVYFGIYRFSCFLLPTEFIGMTMSACCPSHFWIFLRVCRKPNDYGPLQAWLTFGSGLPMSCYFLAFDRSIIFRPLGQTNPHPHPHPQPPHPQPVFTSGHPPLNPHYYFLSCDIL